MKKDRIPLYSPGEIILEDYLKPADLTQAKASELMGLPPSRLNEVIKGKRKIDTEFAIRIAKLFGMNPETWLKLQAEYDLESIRSSTRKNIEKEVTPANMTAA